MGLLVNARFVSDLAARRGRTRTGAWPSITFRRWDRKAGEMLARDVVCGETPKSASVVAGADVLAGVESGSRKEPASGEKGKCEQIVGASD
jgi:hypothetical protein